MPPPLCETDQTFRPSALPADGTALCGSWPDCEDSRRCTRKTRRDRLGLAPLPRPEARGTRAADRRSASRPGSGAVFRASACASQPLELAVVESTFAALCYSGRSVKKIMLGHIG